MFMEILKKAKQSSSPALLVQQEALQASMRFARVPRILSVRSGLRIRVFGFRKIRVGLGKTRVGSGFGRAGRKFKLGILGQFGHSGARVSSGEPELLGLLGLVRAPKNP
jgi:ribosomal protein L16/L10AE